VSRRVLVVKPQDPRLGESLPDAFHRHAPGLAAELTDSATLALDRPDTGAYDAVVCWAERREELELLPRLRAARPQLPILVVSSENDEGFRSLAHEKGATALVPNARNLPTLVGLIEQAVELRLTARETLSMAAQGRTLSKEVRELARQTNLLSQETRRRLERPYRGMPIPLLVSNDPDQAFQMVKAFEKAEMFAPLPILRSTEEAIAYLSGTEPYRNRERYPLPTLIILDFHGSGMSGLEVLGWIRQHDRLKHLPVIMLTATINPEDIKVAYGLQANSYLIKPGNFEELVEMVRAINLYWSSLNVSPDP
jgi:DNA-binding response OmpR family regulator